ncbi:uncharacterized protein BDW43DRAFT_277510 [Aspergillus alliaceus]|uniref:uncharacterized protein n=1 Tax=Petromyces alliaceus TaxID=209559 RepID=UPI0012A4876B|nr:uncharacterized protein BDW43DRAFT_277510 [Aspergillus alliaceus]KAB8233144.1 hypothetical protein BDW43DRAFT_277510 [Aspergillus alliaceus]
MFFPVSIYYLSLVGLMISTYIHPLLLFPLLILFSFPLQLSEFSSGPVGNGWIDADHHDHPSAMIGKASHGQVGQFTDFPSTPAEMEELLGFCMDDLDFRAIYYCLIQPLGLCIYIQGIIISIFYTRGRGGQ